jgi:ketopantoate reductase
MAQDVAAGRPTEREAVFGDLLRRAEALGVRVPRIALVSDLIAGIDLRRDQRPVAAPDASVSSRS